MTIITANELKTRGVSRIEKILQDNPEVIISVRGKPSCVIIDIERYDLLQEQELAIAWHQVRADVEASRYHSESAEAHIARLRSELNDRV